MMQQLHKTGPQKSKQTKNHKSSTMSRKIWVPKIKTKTESESKPQPQPKPKPDPEPESEPQPFEFLNHACLESMQETKLTEWKPKVLESMTTAKTKLQTIIQRFDKTTTRMEKINLFQDAALERDPSNVILLIGFYVSFHELHKKIDELSECTGDATSFDFP